jgi:peptide methionine sulfoxide reductase MsrB
MNNIFYKLYLYYNLYIRHKALKIRATYSQHQEDLFINDYFKDQDEGFYLDIGCYHPIKYSNTALLYNRGWKGVNIDMNQTSIDLFNLLRKKDSNICAAISNEAKETIQYFDHLFSAVNTLNKKFSNKVSEKLSSNNQSKKKISTYKFIQIAKEHNIEVKKIDFINIDAEAHDYEVLESIDLNFVKAKLICIEMLDDSNNLNDQKFKDYLYRYNYNLIKIIGPNGFFELRD